MKKAGFVNEATPLDLLKKAWQGFCREFSLEEFSAMLLHGL
jgi:hypothetical protein